HSESTLAEIETVRSLESFLSQYLRPGKSLDPIVAPKATIDDYGRVYAQGSRKTARAQVWVVEAAQQEDVNVEEQAEQEEASGSEGQTEKTGIKNGIYVNGRPLAEHFPNIHNQLRVKIPLLVTNREKQYNVWALVTGGGPTGQSDAIRAALARALAAHDQTLEAPLQR
ncbi:37S ribosomal protein S9, mitochondrial, partial [Quaeritorhiza haematococci]